MNENLQKTLTEVEVYRIAKKLESNLDNKSLTMAASWGYLQVIKFMVNARWASVHENNDGALREAAGGGLYGNSGYLVKDRYANEDVFEEMVEFLLAKGADVHANNDEALMRAVDHGNPRIVKMLLDHGADVHARNDKALEIATRVSRFPFLSEPLLRAGADPNANDGIALCNACKHSEGNEDLLNLLIEYEANVHVNKDAPLRISVKVGNRNAVNILLKADADVHAYNDQALRLAVSEYYIDTSINMVQMLLEAEANVHARHDQALRIAIRNEEYEKADMLLKAGANIIAKNEAEMIKAAEKGDKETVSQKLMEGADVNAEDGEALYLATKENHTEIVMFLLEKGANIFKTKARATIYEEVEKNSTGEYNYESDVEWNSGHHVFDEESIIEMAARNDNMKLFMTFLNLGDRRGIDKALIYAARNANIDMVEKLLDEGADAMAYDCQAFQDSVLSGNLEVFRLIWKAGADPFVGLREPHRLAINMEHPKPEHLVMARLLEMAGADSGELDGVCYVSLGDSTGEKLDPYLRMDLAEFAKQRKEGVKQFLSGNYRIKIRNE